MTSPEKVQEVRRSGIGGSDIAAIVGISPWRTPLQVWLEKTGRDADVPDEQARERMHWGVKIEDVVARHYASTHNTKIQRVNATLRVPGLQIVMGHIDRAVCRHGTSARWRENLGSLTGADAILEVKTAGAHALSSGEWGDAGTDVVPAYYWMQVQWYMGICQVEVGDVAVLFGGQHYRDYRLKFNESAFVEAVTYAKSWWERHVVGDVAPPPMSANDVLRLFPSDRGFSIEADDAIFEAWKLASEAKRQVEEAQSRYDALVDRIKMYMEGASELVYKGRTLGTWRSSRDYARTDWKAVVEEIRPDASVIEKHTSTQKGSRRFLLKEW